MSGEFPYPIKVVGIRNEDIKNNQGGGSAKVFGEVTTELRESFATKVRNISEVFNDRFEKNKLIPAVAKVELKSEAIAKSHRPTSLFSHNTCPIIGVGRSNELYLEVTAEGLKALEDKLINSHTKAVNANISTLNDIEPFLPKDAIDEIGGTETDGPDNYIKIKLFKFQHEKTNIAVENELRAHLETKQARIVKKIDYSRNLVVYKVSIQDVSLIEEIADFGAVKSISLFPTVSSYKPNEVLVAEEQQFPVFMPEEGFDYPYVGVVDSGIHPEHPYLTPWVECQEEYVLSSERNYNHGSFVGGIIAYGDLLMGNQSAYEGVKIIDVCAIPNDDPANGNVGTLTEDILIEILNEVVPKYSGKVKVWNLSLGSSNLCQDETFSDLAISLDEMQEEYGVIFVISAGNYEERPIRSWPPQEEASYNDRITSPADSVRGITVGSISHVDTTLCKKYEPSPFSRKGPGPSYITKPDLVDFGGSVESSPELNIIGVPSFDGQGNLVQNLGTSFSTPKVASLLSKICHYIEGEPSANLAKALLIHSAMDLRNGDRFVKKDKEYLGYGKPNDVSSILNCTKSSSTIVFEGTIYPTTFIEITDFPFPQVLTENGKCYGEIFITLVYNPPLDGEYGFEYCRSNIEVSLGTTKEDGSYSGEVPFERIAGFEKELIANGMKWSPVKNYHRKISHGINSNPWKLRLDLQGRSNEILQPQDFTLVITIQDPSQEKDVYLDVATQLEQRFVHRNLEFNRVRTNIQV
ncbi:S8 family peptidase [Bacillus thuringiensis]|uniref:S8 family peptidase n=1 Tax=Bacillus thuringiensis TaxID=1428 RepID=UPI000B43D4F8|nr:S8 family peptidase [Bacillus thuringiensis]MED3180207.1 S8 family peptidase [Bacillus thuringiensis]OTY12640.1 hypothetical protein BK734_10735 [Bacillus thuringiensis serovar kim]OUB21241.1 hypothetical protein BK733_04455 [Bacillus thuringiensis serovar xiaguangiensis]